MKGARLLGQDNWRSIAIRGLSYAGEQAVRLLFTAVVGILVARYLGPEGLGLLSYAQAVFGLLLPIVLLGLPGVLVREFSTGADWRVVIASALFSQIPVALLITVAGFVIIATTRNFETQAVLTGLAMTPLPLLATSQSLRSYLEATGRSRTILVAGLLAAVGASVVKIGAILGGADVWVFALAGTVEAAIVAIGLLIGMPARARLRSLRRYARGAVARDLMRESWPLMLAGLAILIYMRVDVVMLGLLADDRATGIYSAAARLSEVWYFLPMAALAALRPLFSRLHAEGSNREYRTTMQRFMTTAVIASYLAVVVVIFVGPRFVILLYGDEYAQSGPVLQLHVLATPFVFLSVAASPWFIDRHLGRTLMLRSSLGAVANVVLNYLLIPPFGARGAALATLISYALSGVLLNGISHRSRPLLTIQLKALVMHWDRKSHADG